jgi:tetratricopeptide (TPR) repeat protein
VLGPVIAKPYRWVELQHEDLDFYSVPRPLPWPREAPLTLPAEDDFPFATLVEGIQRLLADPEASPAPVWGRLLEVIQASDALADAFEAGDLDRADWILDRLARLHPDCPFVYFNKAFVARQRGRKTEALRLYQAAVQAAPNLEFLWMRLGELAEELGYSRQAIRAYRKAQALLPPHPQALEGLARLGALRRLEHINPAGERELVYVTPQEFQRVIRSELLSSTDPARVRTLWEQLLATGHGPLAVEAAQRWLALVPEDFHALRALAEAWHLAGQPAQAEAWLRQCLDRQPEDAWCHYLLARVRLIQNQTQAAWALLDRALALDPNLQPALVLKFGLVPGRSDLQREQQLAAWAVEHHSSQGLLLCSIQARARGDFAAALRYARQAYALAPDDPLALLHYTGLLGQAGELEWMAALTQRMLASGQGDYRVKYQFAIALHALGLKDQALRVLQDTMAGHDPIPPEWQEAIQARLDHWSGLVAESEVPLALFDQGILRRAILLRWDGEQSRELIPAGAPLPQQKVIRLDLKAPTHTVAVVVEQGQPRSNLAPVWLGCFEVEDIDCTQEARPPDLRLTATAQGTLQLSASQGERRLPVKWSLYPGPRVH